MEFVAAKCPSCAGDLRLPDNLKTAKCTYCGVEVVVSTAIKAVQGNADNLLQIAEAALAANNSAEAYDYFTKTLEIEPNNPTALLGKAEAAGRLSTFAEFRANELMAGTAAAVEATLEPERDAMKSRAADVIVRVCEDYSSNIPITSLSKSETEALCLNRTRLIHSLQSAHGYDPKNTDVVEELVSQCKSSALNWKQFVVKSNLELIQMGVMPDKSKPDPVDPLIAKYEGEAKQWLEKLHTISPERHAVISEMYRKVEESIKESDARIAKASAAGCSTILVGAGSILLILLILFSAACSQKVQQPNLATPLPKPQPSVAPSVVSVPEVAAKFGPYAYTYQNYGTKTVAVFVPKFLPRDDTIVVGAIRDVIKRSYKDDASGSPGLTDLGGTKSIRIDSKAHGYLVTPVKEDTGEVNSLVIEQINK